jgi:hypothetical protein
MVRFFTCSLASSVTGEFNTLPLSMQALVAAVGTPLDHFATVLKFPAPPFQLVSQALKPEVASKNDMARIAKLAVSNRLRIPRFSLFFRRLLDIGLSLVGGDG